MEDSMAKITLKGKPVNTIGQLPKEGAKAPDFRLTRGDLTDVTLADFKGKKVILNIVNSLDTGLCAASARKFNTEATTLPNTVVLTVSNDLPFAANRFCETNGIKNVVTVSQLRNRRFGKDYGVEFADGPLEGLLSRAVVVVDEKGTVIHAQQVHENASEPDYDAAIHAVK